MSGKIRDNWFWLGLIVAAVLILYFRPFHVPDRRNPTAETNAMRTELQWIRIEDDMRNAWHAFAATVEPVDREGLLDTRKMRESLGRFKDAVAQIKEHFVVAPVPEAAPWQEYHVAVKRWIAWHEQFARVDLEDFVGYAEGLKKPLGAEQGLDYSKRQLQIVQTYGKEHSALHKAHIVFKEARKASTN